MTTEFANSTKHSSSATTAPKSPNSAFAGPSKHTATAANPSRSSASYTDREKTRLLWGDIPIEDVADYTFESVVLVDGTKLENVTFETLVDIIWHNRSRH
ncbi:hypothetical protein [Bradyrhizobium elkanii]|uniref:hypothetical protein n=1 Tax=Bradyrhizobium elkanii TaxID=29448 RepID=UPI003D1B3CF5